MSIDWEALKRDIVERFLTFETVKGTYLMPAAAAVAITNYFWQNLVWDILIYAACGYLFVEGARKVFVNRVKQEITRKKLVERRLASPPKE